MKVDSCLGGVHLKLFNLGSGFSLYCLLGYSSDCDEKDDIDTKSAWSGRRTQLA